MHLHIFIKLGRHVNYGELMNSIEFVGQRGRSRWASLNNVECAVMLRFALLYFYLDLEV